MVRDTHRQRNAIFAHLLPGQSKIAGAHPLDLAALKAEDLVANAIRSKRRQWARAEEATDSAFELDLEPRRVAVPPELHAALAAAPDKIQLDMRMR